jgi:D-3-phosphoglycerate dehydrogenase
VVITYGSGTRAVAEGVLAHTLALIKRVAPLTELVSGGRWAERDVGGPIGDLDGATIGIIGYGRIGRCVGELAAAFGMRVLAYDPFAPPPAEVACGDLDDLVAASDVLTLRVPLTPENHHLLDAALLARTKPGAVLIRPDAQGDGGDIRERGSGHRRCPERPAARRRGQPRLEHRRDLIPIMV